MGRIKMTADLKPKRKASARPASPPAPSKSLPKPSKPSLGWREWVAIFDLGVQAVKAKVDTGARSSSLHAEDVSIYEKKGKKYVRFVLGGGKRKGKLLCPDDNVCRVPLYDMRWITSSNGTRQRRPVIRVDVHLHGQTWPVDLTLSSRGTMGFPMLLGREAIRGRFIVDPAKSYLSKEHVPQKSVAKEPQKPTE